MPSPADRPREKASDPQAPLQQPSAPRHPSRPPQAAEAFEHCAYGIAVGDPGTNRIAFCNPAFARALGRTVEEVAGLPIPEVYAPEERASVAQHIAEADRTGAAHYDTRVVRKDGSMHPVAMELVSVRDEHGVVAYRVASMRDISRRLHAVQSDQENQERFRLLFEHSLDAVLETEPNGDVLAANPAACALFGRTENEIRQCGRAGLVDLTDPRLPALVEERTRTGRALGELRFRRKDGTHFEGEISTALFSNPRGRSRSSMIIRDLTARRQAEALERIQHALAARLAATADLGDGLQLCLEAALQATGMEAGGVYLLHPHSGALELVKHQGLSPTFIENATRFAADSNHARLIRNGQPLYLRFEELTSPAHDRERHEGLRCLAAVPFRSQDQVIGCLNAASHSREVVSGAARVALETIAAAAGHAVARLRAEAAQRESEDRFRRAIESSPDAIFIQAHGAFAYVNPAAVRLFGAPDAAALVGTSVIKRFAPEQHAQVADRIHQLNEFRQHVPQVEEEIVRADGSRVTVEVSAVPFTHAGAAGALVFAHDISARRTAEVALLRTEEKFAIAFANNPAAIALTSLENGRFVDVNRSWEAMLGYQRDEVIGRSARAMHIWPSPDSAARFVACLQAEGTLRDWEQNFLRRSGEVFTAQLSAQVLTVQGERLVLSTLVDITARKQAEAALRESEANLIEAQRIAQIGSWTFDIGSGRVTWSDELLRIFGLERDAFGGTHAAFVERILPQDREAVLRANQLACTTGQPFEIEYRIVLTGGEIRYIRELGSAARDAAGTVVRLFGTAQDITLRRQAERLLRLRGAALEAAANAIVITNRNGTIEWANPAFTALSGWALDEAVGKNPRDLMKSGKHDAEYYRRMWSTILAGNVWRGEVTNRRRDGTLRTEEMTITPLHGEAGAISHFIAIKQDITEQKAMQQHLLQSQRMEAIGNLAGGIAHDLNNILAPITLVGGLLNDRLSKDSDRELIAMVQAGASRGAEIVKQLLTFSRGQAGERIAVQPRHLIKEMMAIMRETFPREIDLRQQYPADLRTVNADPTQLHQVLLNLCVNSRDAMPNGGHLTITASNRTLAADDPVLPPGSPLGAYVVIEVTDTGHGIPAEIRHRVFEPFFTTKPIGKGTGLGLSTVIGIVRSHGGFVTIDSAPGKGSTFGVYLPAITGDSEVPAPTPTAPAVLPASVATILVVEDERNVREATNHVLSDGGYRVITAVNGADALTLYFQHRSEIRLILTDLMMPVMNGVELIRALQATGSKVKIIAMTGLADAAQSSELASLGINEVVPKPFTGDVLLAVLRRCLTAD